MTSTSTETVTAPPWQDIPGSPADWLQRAREVGAILALDAVERDRTGATPWAEVRLHKDSGLTVILGSVAHGGGGQKWTAALLALRAVSAGDASIGQLLGYHRCGPGLHA